MNSEILRYGILKDVEAFSTRKESLFPYPVITGHQVHGTKVAVVDRPDMTRDDLEGYDALVTNLRGVAIGVRTADCVPILLLDPEKAVIAAVHSGWKGTVQRIVQNAVYVMKQNYGVQPETVKAVIGPCIGFDSFQVGEEVVQYFKDQGFPLEKIWKFNEGEGTSPMYHGHHIDLVGANKWILKESGVPEGNVSVCGIDTYTDNSFFSARREGIQCGRIINSIKLL